MRAHLSRRRVVQTSVVSVLVGLTAACSTGATADGGPVRDGDAEPADTNRPDPDVVDSTDTAETGTDGSAAGDVTADAAPDTAPDAGPTVEPLVIVVPGGEPLVEQFAAAALGEGGPALVYPADDTAMPGNVDAPVFQWEGPTGAGYRFSLRTATQAVDVYTTDWKWQPDSATWDAISTRIRGERATLVVAQLGSGATALVGPAIDLEVVASEVAGAVYYWAPSNSSIVRLAVGATAPEVLVSGTMFSCPGCHALSPDGTRVAYTRGGGTPIGPMGVVSTEDGTQIQPESLSGYYPSFAPDNRHLAAARGGDIVIIDTDTGDDAATLPRVSGTSASQPSWSPRDEAVVFAAGASTGGGGDLLGALAVSNAGIARSERVSGGWAPAEWLVRPEDLPGTGDNLFYPAYSPDANWVAFNRASGSAGAGSSPPGSELWVTHQNPDVTVAPVRLDRANGPAGTTNTWPRWAPEIADGRMWVAFASNRPYGRLGSGEHTQIWIASVRPDLAFAGEDPSSSAYWMPHQSLDTPNHVAYWAPYSKEDEARP